MLEGQSEKQEGPQSEGKSVPQSEVGDITESEMATHSDKQQAVIASNTISPLEQRHLSMDEIPSSSQTSTRQQIEKEPTVKEGEFKKTKKVKRNTNTAAVQDRMVKEPGMEKKKKDKKTKKDKAEKISEMSQSNRASQIEKTNDKKRDKSEIRRSQTLGKEHRDSVAVSEMVKNANMGAGLVIQGSNIDESAVSPSETEGTREEFKSETESATVHDNFTTSTSRLKQQLPASPASKANPMNLKVDTDNSASRLERNRPTPQLQIPQDQVDGETSPLSPGRSHLETQSSMMGQPLHTEPNSQQCESEFPPSGGFIIKPQRIVGGGQNGASSFNVAQPDDDEPKATIIEVQSGEPKPVEENKSSNALPTSNPSKLPDAVPLFPKQSNYNTGPPKSPLDHIKFIQLKRFQQFSSEQVPEKMNVGYDQVGNRRKVLAMRAEEDVKNGGTGGIRDNTVQEAKMDATTHFIKNIVFCRDPSILDRETLHVNQREAFSHENNLDIKKLMNKRMASGYDDQVNFRMAALNRSPLNRRLNQGMQNQQPRALDAQLYRPVDEKDKTLLFESRFESGNLYLAQKVSDNEYNLLMQNDINTQGHTQWFFFRCINTFAGHKVKFNILNYSKPDSLFNYGMKVSIYSEMAAEQQKKGWHKGGENIDYFQNGIRKDVTYYSKSFYTATFTYKFKYTGDTVYFAYAQPYTYSELRDDLASIEADPDRNALVTTKTLCQTLGGIQCEYLTITSKSKEAHVPKLDNRPGIIITSRVHPGETVGSHMMRGVLEFLTDPKNEEARLLRENYVFKIIPMLNPDGVVNGNYRCSLAGCDLNRRWKTPSKMLHPTIYYTKKLVKQIHEERTVVMFCDLHGHSRKQNVFMYGCNFKDNPGQCRVLPYLLSKMNPYFCFDSSRFGVQKSKESTARVALFKELKNVACIYTMESSFAGMDMGKTKGMHFTSDMLASLGRDCCRVILAYQNKFIADELKSLPMFKKIIEAKESGKPLPKGDGDMFGAVMNEFKTNKKLLEAGDGDSSSGSDDAPSEDNLKTEELQKQLPPDKTVKVDLKKDAKDKIAADKKAALLAKQEAVRQKRQPPPVVQRFKEPSPPRKVPPPAPVQKEEPTPPEEKKDDGKKKKPIMKDAWTQTEKSATAEYKAKLMRERARLAVQQQQQADLLKNPQYHTTAKPAVTVHSVNTTPANSQSLTGPNTVLTVNQNSAQYAQMAKNAKGASIGPYANSGKGQIHPHVGTPYDPNQNGSMANSPQGAPGLNQAHPYKHANMQQQQPNGGPQAQNGLPQNNGFFQLGNNFNQKRSPQPNANSNNNSHQNNHTPGTVAQAQAQSVHSSGGKQQYQSIAYNSMQKAQSENRQLGQQIRSQRDQQAASQPQQIGGVTGNSNIITPSARVSGATNSSIQQDQNQQRFKSSNQHQSSSKQQFISSGPSFNSNSNIGQQQEGSRQGTLDLSQKIGHVVPQQQPGPGKVINFAQQQRNGQSAQNTPIQSSNCAHHPKVGNQGQPQTTLFAQNQGKQALHQQLIVNRRGGGHAPAPSVPFEVQPGNNAQNVQLIMQNSQSAQGIQQLRSAAAHHQQQDNSGHLMGYQGKQVNSDYNQQNTQATLQQRALQIEGSIQQNQNNVPVAGTGQAKVGFQASASSSKQGNISALINNGADSSRQHNHNQHQQRNRMYGSAGPFNSSSGSTRPRDQQPHSNMQDTTHSGNTSKAVISGINGINSQNLVNNMIGSHSMKPTSSKQQQLLISAEGQEITDQPQGQNNQHWGSATKNNQGYRGNKRAVQPIGAQKRAQQVMQMKQAHAEQQQHPLRQSYKNHKQFPGGVLSPAQQAPSTIGITFSGPGTANQTPTLQSQFTNQQKSKSLNNQNFRAQANQFEQSSTPNQSSTNEQAVKQQSSNGLFASTQPSANLTNQLRGNMAGQQMQGPNGTRLPVLDSRHQPKDNSTPFRDNHSTGKFSSMNQHQPDSPSPYARTPQKPTGGQLSIQAHDLHINIQQDMLGGGASSALSAQKRNSSNNFETQPTPQRMNHHRNELPKSNVDGGLHQIHYQNSANSAAQQQSQNQRSFRNQSETANMMRVPVPGASKLAGMGSNPDGEDDILHQHSANKQ